LTEKAITIGTFLGTEQAKRKIERAKEETATSKKGKVKDPFWFEICDMLELMGFLLYRRGIRKEQYMDNFPYLYGQLLKVSDELHALYCVVNRNGELAKSLAGSSVYQAAAEAPIRTLSLLGQRMSPYITWAKAYRTKKVSEEGKESWRAGWLLSLYENIATRLSEAWQPDKRFNDEEKAQLFIGYLAKFPNIERKCKDSELTAQNNEEVEENE
jgi:hypothetical protein